MIRIHTKILLFFLSLCLCVCGNLEAHSLTEVENETKIPEEVTPPQPSFVQTHPAMDSQFTRLSNGKDLSTVKVSGNSLYLVKGTGTTFSDAKMKEYNQLKQQTLEDSQHNIHWAFMNLDTHQMISQSLNANKKIFGASSSKIYVGGALLHKTESRLSNSQLQKMADMIVVSSNTAWTALQQEVGDGNANRGREYIYNFTQGLGHTLTRGFQGYWGNIHGNELVATETVEFLYDIYTQAFDGADTLWKLMHTSRTGASRGKKYIPQNIYVGGKTGTYDGPTENPETGTTYNVRVRNHVMVFNIQGVQYGLAIFANTGSDESVALLAGGLIREYTSL